jgi:hypothetical protein
MECDQCGQELTPLKPRGKRQRDICGGCYAAVRSEYNVECVFEIRKKKAGPPTRARLGRRPLSDALGATPTPSNTDLDGTSASKVSRQIVRRLDPVLEEVKALTVTLVDVAAAGDTLRALLDAEMGRAACLELLMMDETDVVFTEVLNLLIELTGVCSCATGSLETCSSPSFEEPSSGTNLECKHPRSSMLVISRGSGERCSLILHYVSTRSASLTAHAKPSSNCMRG